MQTAKDYACKLLPETVRKVFLRKDFKVVSMCETKRLGVGLSNIYDDDLCKDDLLADLLSSLLKVMNNRLFYRASRVQCVARSSF